MSSCDCSNYMCDFEPAEVYDVSEIVARKDHVCANCPFPIRRGEQYQRIKMLFEGEWSTEKRHVECAALIEAIDDLFDTSDYEYGFRRDTTIGEMERCVRSCMDDEYTDDDTRKRGRNLIRQIREFITTRARQ